MSPTIGAGMAIAGAGEVLPGGAIGEIPGRSRSATSSDRIRSPRPRSTRPVWPG
jgi:hypothetical protein